MRKRTKARECALQILYSAEVANIKAAEALSDFWGEHPSYDGGVKEFAGELVAGALDNMEKLDSTISACAANWTLKRMAVVDKNILRLAAYELLFRNDIPPKVTINEAVDIAKKFGDENSGKFVNGILDKIGKEAKRIESRPSPEKGAQRNGGAG